MARAAAAVLLAALALSAAPAAARTSPLGKVGKVALHAAEEALPSSPKEALGGAPWFCHGIDCPKYTVASSTDDYELRSYEATVWASTVVSGVNYTKALNVGFMRLFGYISGDNEAQAKVPMTAPVRASVTPGQGPFCESNFTVSFFVPHDHQAAPPKPTSADVYVSREAPFSAYVAQFGGYASESEVLEKAAKLGEVLSGEGKAFRAEGFDSAGYDPPFRPLGRHNEVWLTAR